MNEGKPVQGVVLAHGSMAEGIVDAVTRISGAPAGVLDPVSNTGKSPEALEAELAKYIGEGPVVFFTDLPSGSCAVAARICCQETSQAAVISGVNLPILLDFVFHQNLPLEELVPRLMRKGREGLRSVPEYPVEKAV